ARVGGEVDEGAAGAGLGEAQRALQVAARRDLNERDAGVLLVFGTEAAVVRAAAVGGDAVAARLAGGLVELVPLVVGDIRADEVLDQPMLGAALAEVDAAVADDDLGVHEPPAVRAEALGQAAEGVVAEEHKRTFPT